MNQLRFVPSYAKPTETALREFLRRLRDVDKFVVLTGAGISTESGIPDYRSAEVGLYARTNHRPMLHEDFMRSAKARQRYWARNFLAWPRFRDANPNKTHFTIASWERSDKFSWLITQNVDGLHAKAGSEQMSELHGTGWRVKCMECGFSLSREELQKKLSELNESWEGSGCVTQIRPDGDVELLDGAEETFRTASCEKCKGILKTDVVFFGDNVPRSTVDTCYQKIEDSDGLLVLGSSLEVMSGYRFVLHAHIRSLPIFIINIGPTRADSLATHRLHCAASEVVSLI